jgi:radical SAM protein with 4Fe4S-binding SPASM domain
MSDKKCILAYTALYVAPNGNVQPCCISKPFKSNPKFNQFSSIEEIYNSEPFKNLRKQMDDGIEPEECDYCFKKGHKLMTNWNKNWEAKWKEDLYNDDYSINSLQYLDIRFSNLCNLKCRMCSVGLSSSWHDDIVELTGNKNIPKHINIGEDAVYKFTPNDLKNIKHLYFAGGEPFITDEFFSFIEMFDVEVARNIDVYINTNLSTLFYKKEFILDKLKKFRKITIGASCDGYGKIGEYQRTNFSHNKFFSNFKNLIEYSKSYTNFKIEVEYTITIINVFHIFDFIDYMKSNFKLSENDIHFHYAITPYYYSVIYWGDDFINDVKNYLKLNSHYYRTNVNKMSKSIVSFEDFLNVPFINSFNEKKINFKEYIYKMDIMRNTNYKEVCPWIEDFFTYTKALL